MKRKVYEFFISWKENEFYDYFISWKEKNWMNVLLVERGKSAWISLDANRMHLKINSHLLKFKNSFSVSLKMWKCTCNFFLNSM